MRRPAQSLIRYVQLIKTSILACLTTFTSYIIYRKEGFFKWSASMLIVLALAVISGKYLHSKLLTAIFFMLLILPFVFLQRMMMFFTRKVIIQLDTNQISFDIRRLDNDEEEETRKFKISDIASYQIQFPNSRFACLILKLTSGKTHEFSFRRQVMSDTQSDTELIIETVHKFFEQHAIEFAPSFFASTKGLYTIIFLVVLLCVPFAIAIHLNKNLPATIFGSIAIIVQIMSRRSSDLNFYKKWKKL